jgi:fumarate reductase flavoprotein subunit
VIVLGRRNPFASNSALGGGEFALVDTPLQREKGIRDSSELLSEDILKANRHSIPRDVVTAAAQEGERLYEWMTELGAQFCEVKLFPGHSVGRVHLEKGMTGANTLRLLLKAVISKGADIKLGMVAEHLILNNSNEVNGVQATAARGKTEIRAKRAVVLAAGGFGRNQNMMSKYLPRLAEMSCLSGAGSTGDGIRMGMEAGAEPLNMDAAELHSLGSVKRGFRILGASETLTKGAILVNKNGRRFVDESKGYVLTAPSVMCQSDGVAFLIFNDSVLKNVTKLCGNMDKCLNMGLFQYGNTALDLAKTAGIEPHGLEETIEEYFPSGNLYGTWVKPVVIQTMGGLRVNAEAQVMHSRGYPIPHLYAAGDNTPSLAGAATEDNPCPGYLTGTGYMWALASGRIAGQNAAKNMI